MEIPAQVANDEAARLEASRSKGRLQADELLRALTKGTIAVTGGDFFRSLVEQLAGGLHARYSFVAECLPNRRARSLAFWKDGHLGENFEYDLPGTPCMKVAEGRTCQFPERVAELFPQDKALFNMGAVSYLGVPLFNVARQVIGHVVVFDDKPMPADPRALSVVESFAARAGAELEREQAQHELRILLAELEDQKRRISDQLQQATEALRTSEERFRDLFDEAPIAYVHEGLDSRFIRANHTAMSILGIKPEEVAETYGKSLVPSTPEAQRCLREALRSIGRGKDTSGVVLELRRKDNDKPVWVQWWSRPDPSGGYTRTMFIDITDRVLMEREKAQLEAQSNYLQEEIRNEHNFEEIVGNGPALLKVLGQLEQVASTDSTVLILGETGTGKELVARAIHGRSRRNHRLLVKINCAAISAGLVESELFGHVRGAFTGALANRDGRFKLADGGTLFLDEVGELPPETQVKLLRVLQEQEFEPVGSSQSIRVDVRIIAATNKDLAALVSEGKFRSDLYYRLNVLPLRVPPLRERQGDVSLLAAFFVQKFAQKHGKPAGQISEETMRRLEGYDWPGNVRELQNVIERAVVLAQSNTLTLSPALDFASPLGKDPRQKDEPERRKAIQPSSLSPQPASGSLADAERRHIESVLAQAKWMIEGEGGAARILNLHPSTLRSRMRKLGIQRPRPSMPG
jgi:PAS domain S-box-containing protein